MTFPLPTLGLFAGYGGLELGLERAGVAHTVAQAEIDPWCREVERRHWPHAHRFEDVREVTRGAVGLDGVDLVCGGFPCQPVSVAGKRRAQADERWLWPEFARIVSELRPAIVVAENVPGLRTAGLRDVLADLAALGFDAEWTCFRAWDLGAPHLRDRFWLVATDPDRAELRDEPGWLRRSVERKAAAVAGGARANLRRTGELDPDARVLEELRRAPEREIETIQIADGTGVRCAADGHSNADRVSSDVRAPKGREDADADGARERIERALAFSAARGWGGRAGWSIDPAPRVDDGPAEGLARGGRERARKAAGNGVVVACAEAVGVAIREAVSVAARAVEDAA